MSNESNREDIRTVSPGDLQASDFFPPGTGWNKEKSGKAGNQRRDRDCEDEDDAIDGVRPH